MRGCDTDAMAWIGVAKHRQGKVKRCDGLAGLGKGNPVQYGILLGIATATLPDVFLGDAADRHSIAAHGQSIDPLGKAMAVHVIAEQRNSEAPRG